MVNKQRSWSYVDQTFTRHDPDRCLITFCPPPPPPPPATGTRNYYYLSRPRHDNILTSSPLMSPPGLASISDTLARTPTAAPGSGWEVCSGIRQEGREEYNVV
ncbi:hypothetical protein Pmani_020395 [Petrolisthes manimaculis]|uniref:Uncharacterized protein n=1 Tax=Petrolisthes manimaculis TaxID=1843537 RepID=A0AAE1PGT9_9EUCA|nr:hypothetical protein Pmani_020395 [Petrolisthes manimaculis]